MGAIFFYKANIALRYQLMRFNGRIDCYKDVCLSPTLQQAAEMQLVEFFFLQKDKESYISKIAGWAAIQFFKKSTLGRFSRGQR